MGVIFSVFVFNGLLYSIVPIFLNIEYIPVAINPTTTIYVPICQLFYFKFYRLVSYIYLVQACIVPFSLMIASSVACIRALYLSRSRIEVFENREMKSRRSKDLKFSVNSITLNVLYVCLQTPLCLAYFLPFTDLAVAQLFSLWAQLFFYLNFSISFLTYMISNSIFRRELLHVFRIRRVTSKSSTGNLNTDKT